MPKPLPPTIPDNIEIAMCGAHMSGLPFNTQLTNLNTIFVRKAQTSEEYKFYALSGEPPAKPELFKVQGVGTGCIALEIGSLPLTAFGQSMLNIPSPLDIGSIDLSDGSSVKGFLCERSGLKGALDITTAGCRCDYLTSQGQST